MGVTVVRDLLSTVFLLLTGSYVGRCLQPVSVPSTPTRKVSFFPGSSSSSSSLSRKSTQLHVISVDKPTTASKSKKFRSPQEPSSVDEEDLAKQLRRPKIVLVAGFESFNRDLYEKAAKELDIDLHVFADTDIRSNTGNQAGINAGTNLQFQEAVESADALVGSLLVDYDDVLAVRQLLTENTSNEKQQTQPRLFFECATELMELNQVGKFNMMKTDDGPSGPPPAVKAILSKFGSGKEEDKLNGYIKLLKVGPDLLKYVPGDKPADLRTWLEAYRYWNQGGASNVRSMLSLVADVVRRQKSKNDPVLAQEMKQEHHVPPPLVVTPDIGLLHPVRQKEVQANPFLDPYFSSSPKVYLDWRLSQSTRAMANRLGYKLAPNDAPRIAVLLYRKHVITELRYVADLITMMEQQGVIPIPIFINGVEAHTIVRDLLTSAREIDQVYQGKVQRDATYQPYKAVSVDAIVNTVGFPLVGGPAGSMQAGRNVDVAQQLLSSMDVPYVVASPLLLQSIPQWKQNGVLGLQSVVLYSLPELDGAIDTVVLGGLVGDKIALVPERVRKLTDRLKAWIKLRQTPRKERKIAVSLYGFPPNVGAVGTAALLDVPRSLDSLLARLHKEGYDLGSWASDPDASGESLVAAMGVLCENPLITAGADRMQTMLEAKIERAVKGDQTVAATLARPNAGLGGARVRARNISWDELEKMLGKYMAKKVRRAWSEKDRGPGVSSKGELVVAGLQVGNVFLFVQPLLGIEGDPMRLLFERDLTPHPQYCAMYKWLQQPQAEGGIGSEAVIHFGMHGTVEWLPGQPLGNDRKSWSDELLGPLPNLYVYAANNPSESILAKRRGYGTVVSYNVPPYGRAGLYLELANLKELVDEYRSTKASGGDDPDLFKTIYDLSERSGMVKDVPLPHAPKDDKVATENVKEIISLLSSDMRKDWVAQLSDYLVVLQDRLFSSGLHVFGAQPKEEELVSYLEAYFGDRLAEEEIEKIVRAYRKSQDSKSEGPGFFAELMTFFRSLTGSDGESQSDSNLSVEDEAKKLVSLLDKSTEEIDSILSGLDGGYIRPGSGGDLLRDGPSVLPTGRNIHALDPYRMPSAGAWARGQRAADEIIRQHRANNNGNYPETVAVTLWGLDAIKTRGESVAIALALVGAKPVKEGTGRIVRFDLVPLEELGRPRIDVLASLSGIFRDSFANIVDLLDDMFERAAIADEPVDMNFIKKHSSELVASGVKDRVAARLFSNPPGDYGSMVNEVVGTGDWEENESLGETWKGRNVYSYGRNEGGVENAGTARPEVLDKLLSTTERVVQEIDSVEYGLSDIQEYYANTGALKKAAENRKAIDPTTGRKKKVALSVIEAFGNSGDNAPIPVKDVEEVLRLEYRSKLLNPKWRDAMLNQGSGGAYEISQRMTAMIGWAATAEVDNFVFDQAAERYAMDEDVAKTLQRNNPEAFKNVVRRLLEAAGRGMWSTDEETLDKLRELYSDADDLVEQGSA